MGDYWELERLIPSGGGGGLFGHCTDSMSAKLQGAYGDAEQAS